MSILGVCWDQFESDWVLFGETAPNRPGLPLDALILAFHAACAELEAPGVDIRAASTNSDEALQKVASRDPHRELPEHAAILLGDHIAREA
jgi:hypothetical protein